MKGYSFEKIFSKFTSKKFRTKLLTNQNEVKAIKINSAQKCVTPCENYEDLHVDWRILQQKKVL